MTTKTSPYSRPKTGNPSNSVRNRKLSAMAIRPGPEELLSTRKTLARKAANGDWYLGAMTDWSARNLEVDLNFLGEDNYVAEIWEDGINANRNANDFTRRSVNINASSKISIHLAPGGGWVARITTDKE